jgi:hypothetical protein
VLILTSSHNKVSALFKVFLQANKQNGKQVRSCGSNVLRFFAFLQYLHFIVILCVWIDPQKHIFILYLFIY